MFGFSIIVANHEKFPRAKVEIVEQIRTPKQSRVKGMKYKVLTQLFVKTPELNSRTYEAFGRFSKIRRRRAVSPRSIETWVRVEAQLLALRANFYLIKGHGEI